MPRHRRIVVADCAHHVTQRGNQRAVVFSLDQDRSVYLNLAKRNARNCGVSVLSYALVPNHVHWVVTPRSEKALAEAFGRSHYCYSHYFEAKRGTTVPPLAEPLLQLPPRLGSSRGGDAPGGAESGAGQTLLR